MTSYAVSASTKESVGVQVFAKHGNMTLEGGSKEDREHLSPVDLLPCALASCIALTVRGMAQAHTYPLEYVDVDVSSSPHFDKPVHTTYAVRIKLHGDLSDKQRTALLRGARTCHVHKLLTGENTFSFELVS